MNIPPNRPLGDESPSQMMRAVNFVRESSSGAAKESGYKWFATTAVVIAAMVCLTVLAVSGVEIPIDVIREIFIFAAMMGGKDYITGARRNRDKSGE